MGSVWKRLQRVNKRAAKFQFTASYHELRLETTTKWRPSFLSVVWTRRSRRVASAPLPWEPDMMNPLVGHIFWPVPDNHPISVTLFKDPRTHELEDKDWTFVIEDITTLGKKRVLASASINMRKYASIESTQQSFTLSLKPNTRKITAADLELTISCVFLREGKATDEDMQSVVSLMSVNNNCDVAPLDDLEDIPDLESSGDISDHLYDFTQQLEQMTTSLNGCVDLPTPLSVPSLSEDPTPLAEVNYLNFELEADKQIGNSEEQLKTPHAMRTSFQQQTANSKFGTTPVNEQRDAKVSTSTNQIGKTVEKKILEASNSIEKNMRKIFDFKGGSETTRQQTSVVTKEHDDGTSEKISTIQTSDAKSAMESITPTLTPAEKNTLSIETVTTDVKNKKPPSSVTGSTPIVVPIADTKYGIDIDSSTYSSAQLESKHSSHSRIETKRSELQPLKLKKNYEHDVGSISTHINNSTTISSDQNTVLSYSNNANASNKPLEKIVLKENTPGQDLLEWCKEVTMDYPTVKVTNLTTSWRNGMAFCAIIHHFEPELIDMTQLSAHDVVGNCRIAFDAAEALGIPRVIEPRDMSLLAVPDKLAVMTYLHQLRAHFTGKQLLIEQIGPTSDESSYVIGNYKSDNLPQNLLNLSHLKAQMLHQNSIDDIYEVDRYQISPTAKKDVKNLILSGSRSILGKVLSPTKDKNSINASQHGKGPTTSVMQANQPQATTIATNEGDLNIIPDYDKQINNPTDPPPLHQQEKPNQMALNVPAAPTSSTTMDLNAANKILSRHKEMSEKAKMMIEKLKISSGDKNEKDDERKQRLREQARKLILETRTRAVNGGHNIDSPNSPTKFKHMGFSPERTISPIHNVVEAYDIHTNTNTTSGSNCSTKAVHSPTKKFTPSCDTDTNNIKLSPSHRYSERFNGDISLHSFNAVMERISPKNEKKGDKLSYIESELEALEREQEAIDQKASSLEKKLRAVMGGNPSNNSTNRNSFFRLIRNSIGGGDSIRIKLLDIENDGELSLSPSGESSHSVSSTSLSSDDYTQSTSPVKCGDKGLVHSLRRHSRESQEHNITTTRPRSHSCIVDKNETHHGKLPFLYHILSTSSNKHSSCDNLKSTNDEDKSCRRSRDRRRSRTHSNFGETEETEEQLLSQWFTLVNKKNALLRRQMQLNILEQESDLERKYTMLNQELRAAQSVEDWRKTEAQREKERLLLEELVAIVDKRDQLVQHLHSQEIAIEDDHEIARELEQVDISGGKEKCVLQ